MSVVSEMSEVYNVGYFNYNDAYFPSGVDGTYIVDATSGAKFPWKVGSRNEVRFFRVSDRTCTMSSNGRKSNGDKTTNKLFYTSPESYMKHRNVKLDEEVVALWHNRQLDM